MKDERTIADVLCSTASSCTGKDAIICGTRRLTYEELYEKACRLCNILLANGIEGGSKVGLRLPRSPEYVVAYFGATMAGAVIVPFDPNLTVREIYSTLSYCDVQLLVSNREGLAFLEDAGASCPNLQAVLLFEQSDCDSLSGSPVSMEFFLPRAGRAVRLTITASCSRPSLLTDPGSLALLLHTSGTTSAPKRVMLSHRNVISNASSHIASLDLRHDDKVLIALPMFFGYCNTAQMLTHVLLGGTLVLMPGLFTPARFCHLVKTERVTTFTGVPTMLLYLLQYQALCSHDLASLRYVCFGGSVMPQEPLQQLIQKLPAVGFVHTYGQTEASPRVTTLLPQDAMRKRGSVGRAIPGVEVSIFGQDGHPLSPLEIGEVVVRGDNVMLGYYKRPEITSEVIRDGQLFTGDMGYLDDDRYLYLTGRRRNMIIRAGINIYPEEIEEYLLQHPDVIEAAVVGEEHPIQGQVPVGIIVMRDGASPTTDELIAFCKKGLAPYKIPTRIEFRDELPKTYNQKTQRHKLGGDARGEA